VMRLTRPSAGDTTMPSRIGVTPLRVAEESRRTTRSPRVPSQPSGDHSQNSSRLASAKNPDERQAPRDARAQAGERMEARTDMDYSAGVERVLSQHSGGRIDGGPRPAPLRPPAGCGLGMTGSSSTWASFLARLSAALALAVPHAGVEPALGEQLVVRAALDDGALVEHDDLVGTDDGGEPMRESPTWCDLRDTRSSASWILALGVAVERGGGLVEQQDRRRLEDGARNGDALLLAAGGA